ncbi:exodeoxyribonuclease V alpha subunit [Kineosphaera limosa]|uniref:RecBCD enzyme subunit RecD n=1 Tax=Kineosphaera limosa NBRC 100340 TaxID=1184609 RepID=K6XF80_9MICO|nr:exodeoxyribonuclease V subunit alpha [Kineosphaera limosa]NYE00098.1 exodeoxyribonuclease V alpha subunit [Kineosphaera limosa]GAB97494.1 exodeoxyribonuclease V alpha chain [Kineosphaera limosa NBRC 100340]
MSLLEVFEPADARDRRLALGATGQLAAFNEAGVLSAADVHIARAVARASREQDEVAVLAAAFATRAVRLGSVAVDLADLAAAGRQTESPAPAGVAGSGASEPGGDVGVEPERPDASGGVADLPWPDPATWQPRVQASKLVAQGVLVVEHDLVYLQRYHHQEVQVVDDLNRRAAGPPPPVDEARLQAGLERYFAEGDSDQRAAAQTAVRSWTTVITGGPGTGKTTSAATILALLAEQGQQDHSTAGKARPLRIGLAAPTGKAAARMQEALREALTGSPERPGVIAATANADAATRAAVAGLGDLEAVTLHRLLGVRPDRGTRFRHHRGNRLPHDVVLIDEASMVSLTHMARLLEALRPTTRLILVGDPDQLVSVDAGAVLADLVAGAQLAEGKQAIGADSGTGAGTGTESGTGSGGGADGATAGGATGGPLRVAGLRRVHRYGAQIGEVAQALREGDADAVMALLRGPRAAGADAEVLWIDDSDPATSLQALEPLLTRQARAIYDLAQVGDAPGALAAAARHRLLCAHREGPFGVRTWNARVEGWLRQATGDGLYDPMYIGRPLLITANDYATGVVNGDTGVIVRATGRGSQRVAVIAGQETRGHAPPAPPGQPADLQSSRPAEQEQRSSPEGTAFAGLGGGFRVFAPSRLGEVQTLHAMTVHKSQGSQADAVTVLLPERGSPLLTRELLYTGVTRARNQVRVVGSEAVIREAVQRRVVRASGLRRRLAPPQGEGGLP